MGVVGSATFVVILCALCSIVWSLLERTLFNAVLIHELQSYADEHGLTDLSFIDAAMWRNQDD